ncbi:S-adenosyl-L-methionine-dependent methyltransferase [Nemania sp. NC0429]|nr:S-adenosyl-L-methionine-dependent methyltransferase [Nemania sp. NC0429]
MPREVYTIDEEDDVHGEELSRLERGLRRLRQTRRAGHRIPVVDLTEDENEQKELLEYESRIIRELGSTPAAVDNLTSRRQPSLPLRNRPSPTQLCVSSCRYNGILITQGILVEVPQRPRDEYSWQFLYVLDLYKDRWSGDTTIRGIRLTRHRYMRGKLPRAKNELCALYNIDRSDARSEDDQAAVKIPVQEVIRTRAFTRTNDAFPSHRFNRQQWKNAQEIEDKGMLVQRWKHYQYWRSTTKRSYSGAVVHLKSTDITDSHFKVADDKLRNQFRGGIVRGGSWRSGHKQAPTMSLHSDKNETEIIYQGRDQRYTADDIFCGAGGASRGKHRAGLHLSLACDLDKAAAEAYKKNFPHASVKQMDVSDVIEDLENSTEHVDFLHISPPCQFFSPFHVHRGKNDEANIAALFLCGGMLERRRPRITTGEQTFGLLFDQHEEFFNALVGQHTALGYSFSWDILKFKEYGLPSIRRRLIWIASCPGEALPPFPPPTHSESDHRLPALVTLRDVLTRIKPGSENTDRLHNVKDMLWRAKNSKKFPAKAYDDRVQVGTVTTAGSECAHPSGKRNFTLRELADIQGFPPCHKFVGTMTQIRRQIGNAVPPPFSETLYRHLKQWVMHQDRVLPRPKESESSSRTRSSLVTGTHSHPHDIMVISSDEEAEVLSQRPSSRNFTTIDDSEDVVMMDIIDLTEETPYFSRESSRTLSAESLPSLMEVDVDSNTTTLEARREQARRVDRRALFYQGSE